MKKEALKPNTYVEQWEIEACAVKKIAALEKVVSGGPCEAPAEVTQLNEWLEDIVALNKEHAFPVNELLKKYLPRTSRMIHSEQSKPILSMLHKKLVVCISDIDNPFAIERVMREFQHEELNKPTHKQLVERTRKILQHRGEKINGQVKNAGDEANHVRAKVDLDTEHYIIEATASLGFEALANVVGTHYLYNGNGNGKQKVVLTPYGKFNLIPEKDVLETLAKHNIVWWGITEERKIVNDNYDRVF